MSWKTVTDGSPRRLPKNYKTRKRGQEKGLLDKERIERLERVVYDLSKAATISDSWQSWSDSLYEFIKLYEKENSEIEE